MKIKRADIILVAVILLLFGLLLLFSANGKNLIAEIYVDGEVFDRIELSEVSAPYDIQVNHTVIRVETNAIGFSSSDCPDKTCVNTGRLEKANSVAACVPNSVVIIIKSDNNASYDGITG